MKDELIKGEQIKEDRKKAERAKIEQKIEARKKEKEELHEELLVGKQELKKHLPRPLIRMVIKKYRCRKFSVRCFLLKKMWLTKRRSEIVWLAAGMYRERICVC